MNQSQREAAERLIAEHPTLFMNDLPDWCDDAFHLLRELAADSVQETMQKKPSTASQFESVKEAKKVAEAQLSYYRKMMADKSTEPVVNQQMTTEPAQEPVAWHVCSVNSDGSLSLEFAAPWEEAAHEHINDAINEYDIDGAASWVVRPVYASPQQRKPLSADQIRDAVNDHAFWATSKNFICRIARAIECAHGIIGEST